MNKAVTRGVLLVWGCLGLLAACEQLPFGRVVHKARPEHDAGEGPRMAREAAMNNQWQSRRLSELLHERGPPTLVMNIPGGGNPPGFVVVYGVDRPTGCIDAFALMPAQDPVIRVYHCR
jgi:hypothetical protein